MNRQLELDNVAVLYGRNYAAKEVSFSLKAGEIGCLLGPSGCGKTTLLRAIAGFESLAEGKIHLHGREVSNPSYTLPTERRRVGMVFQDFALFPHLSVEQNIAFGLSGLSKNRRDQRVTELLSLIGLDERRKAYPHQLSGGQQQRIALARAMAPRPEILLLDEPFSSLDAELREQLAQEVRALLKSDGVTGIMVTHDQHEAFAMADCIGVMCQGELQQWGEAYTLYHRPDTVFVADFLGQGTLLRAEIVNQNVIRTSLGEMLGKIPEKFRPGEQVQVLIRPDDLFIDAAGEVSAEVVERAFRGAEYIYTLKLHDGAILQCLMPSHQEFVMGEQVRVGTDIQDLVIFAQ